MLSFKSLIGLEGIDKLNECVSIIDEIFADEEILKHEGTFAELATPIYKQHTASIEKLFEILGEKPESSIAILSSITSLLLEISTDKDIASFFMGTSKNLRRMISAMRNTKAEQ